MSGLMTFDANQVNTTGAFLVSELEKLDQTMHVPLYNVTWGRDINIRPDVAITDKMSSFTLTDFATVGGAKANGKNFISGKTTVIANVQVGTKKIALPLNLWALGLLYSIIDLQSSIKLGRSIDATQHEGMRIKWQMDTDEQVYIGDKDMGVKGMLNLDGVPAINSAVSWMTATPDQIRDEISSFLNEAWKNTGYSVCPAELRIPPEVFSRLSSQIVSSAGNISLLKYLEENTIANSINGKPLNIQPLKWCKGIGAAKKDRVMAYTNQTQFIRFPMVQLTSTPIQYVDLHQKSIYYGALGAVEAVYPETISYMDGV